MNDMIKEYAKPYDICVIRENNYGKRFSKILRMVNEAKRDFPTLKDEDFKIVVYGGRVHKNQLGVEFQPPTTPGEEYVRIDELETEL